jgi:hypothetical protein
MLGYANNFAHVTSVFFLEDPEFYPKIFNRIVDILAMAVVLFPDLFIFGKAFELIFLIRIKVD